MASSKYSRASEIEFKKEKRLSVLTLLNQGETLLQHETHNEKIEKNSNQLQTLFNAISRCPTPIQSPIKLPPLSPSNSGANINGTMRHPLSKNKLSPLLYLKNNNPILGPITDSLDPFNNPKNKRNKNTINSLLNGENQNGNSNANGPSVCNNFDDILINSPPFELSTNPENFQTKRPKLAPSLIAKSLFLTPDKNLNPSKMASSIQTNLRRKSYDVAQTTPYSHVYHRPHSNPSERHLNAVFPQISNIITSFTLAGNQPSFRPLSANLSTCSSPLISPGSHKNYPQSAHPTPVLTPAHHRTCSTCRNAYSSGNWYKSKQNVGEYLCKSCYVSINRKRPAGKVAPYPKVTYPRRFPEGKLADKKRECNTCASRVSSGDWYKDKRYPPGNDVVVMPGFICQRCYQRTSRERKRNSEMRKKAGGS